MSAPVADRTRTRRPSVSVGWKGTGPTASTTTTREAPARRIPAQRGSVTVPAQRRGSGAAKAAYARRDQRNRRLVGAPRRAGQKVTTGGRAQFVLLIMALLATALVLTLWLSTAAAADSYTLQDARTAARDLTEQSERLHREVAGMESAPALAQRATELGMVPVQDPARLVVAPDGTVTVVGEPSAATRPAAPVAPIAPAPADPAQPAAPAPADPAQPAAAAPGDPMPAQAPAPSQHAADAGAQQQTPQDAQAPANPNAEAATQEQQEPRGGAAQDQQAAQAPAPTGGGAG
ncbi:hypothetical protein LWC33_26355 [Pseudonocardia sp. RS11V-5]|uniref:hypothetical protein n=1 Tax=Pseudonocardia terrae TaxID=2905831 RepID=UPI001E3440EC|nr:hypothetical protein [Pseudonocardia terrae]MCE3554962.1 hypothetical protein [Pseudonocardia terrae]